MQKILVSPPVRVMLRVIVPLSILTLCVVLLTRQVSVELVRSLPARLGDIALWRWGLALLFTAGSFWAVAQYDALAHRMLRTGIAPGRARITGAVGIALGQTLGFGVFTGALARWRMLSDLDLAQAAKVSAFVSVSFVFAWGLLTALASLVLPAPAWVMWPAGLVVASLPAVAALLFFCPRVHLRGMAMRLPTFRTSGAVLGWSLADMGLASLALFVLLPAGTIPFAAFFPLFLIALGSGLISNTPGGVGPFELVLLTALPFSDPAPILTAILGYRVVYYALPAILAGGALLRPFGAQTAKRPFGALHRATPSQRIPMKPTTRSEVGVVTQNGGAILHTPASTLATWPTGQTLTQFADPLAGRPCDALDHLRHAAADAGAFAMIYKCAGRMGAAARRAGWRVLHIADEAVIDLADYDTAIPARRTLRRKLRAAQKAQVRLVTGAPLPATAMARVDKDWQQAHGTARGGSMGRYCPTYVADQWVGCAYVEDRLVAFVTAHRARDEWCLDLMRHDPNVPDGPMHSLVDAAITAARTAKARRFSLAAAPACPDPSSAIWRWAAQQIAARAGGRGLRQFKSAFAPRWVPLYGAAQSWATLALGLADIARAIHAPVTLRAPDTPSNTKRPHHLDENYEVEARDAA